MKPFLKWAGGKGALLPELLRLLPPKFARYHEPFLGGGALYFALKARGHKLEQAKLNDLCKPLMFTYSCVRDHVDDVIIELARHAQSTFEEDGKTLRANYYAGVRQFDRSPTYDTLRCDVRAARFIYLNKTCFNGLYRVNKKGHFNVPIGKFKTPPVICNTIVLRAASEALQGAQIFNSSFADRVDDVRKHDLVYFDPPYVPLNATSDFTGYTEGGFGSDQQELLAAAFEEIARRGAYAMLSNADAPWVRNRYKNFRIETVQAPRSINSKAAKRGPINEVVVCSWR